MNKKNLFITLSLLVILCLSVAALVGCTKKNDSSSSSGGADSSPADEPEATLTLTRNAVQLVFGQTAVVMAKYKDEVGKTLVWKTSDSSVATVEDGVITSVGLGSATVTATYGTLKAECSVSVTYGDYQPTLSVERLGDELSLLKGEYYELNSYVTFNGKKYDCDLSADIANKSIASFAGGKIQALSVGETEVTLKGIWNGFETPLMEKTFVLTVTENDVSMYMTVETDDGKEVTDEVTLYVTDSFGGERYINSASVKFIIMENGTEKTGSLVVSEGSDIIKLENDVVTPVGLGEAIVTASYQNKNGVTFTKDLHVNVVCPVIAYTEHVEWTSESLKNILLYFEDGAALLYARQGDKELKHTKRILQGVKFDGSKTEPVEVQTTKGGYIFEDIYGCDLILTNENFASTLTLGTKILSCYYALGGDIGSPDAPIDMKNQKNATDGANFAGTFDGRGHTVYAGTYENGIFGGYGYNAVIKNTKFVITFKNEKANGITSDKGRWAKNPKMNATIENVHIVTTNFNEGNHAISEYRVELLKMKDVLVEVNGAESIADFDGRDNVSVLFGIDYAYYGLMVGNVGLEAFDNVRVVVNKFLPMSNGKLWDLTKILSFAINDEVQFGTVIRMSETRDSYKYCTIIGAERHSEWLNDIKYSIDKTAEDGYIHENCIFFCYALKKFENGGVYRYNTIEELKNAGVTQVGDWIVA